MFGFIIRPFRVAHRYLGRTPIEKREAMTLTDTRKVLLTYRSAMENSKAQVGLYTERVNRLQVDLALELTRVPEKRGWDWIRFDQNNLLTAIKDDLYEAEKKLHEGLSDYEANSANVAMFEMREKRLMASIERRHANSLAAAPKVALTQAPGEMAVEYDPGNGQIDLIPKPVTIAALARQGQDIEGSTVTRPATARRQTAGDMGGLVTA